MGQAHPVFADAREYAVSGAGQAGTAAAAAADAPRRSGVVHQLMLHSQHEPRPHRPSLFSSTPSDDDTAPPRADQQGNDQQQAAATAMDAHAPAAAAAVASIAAADAAACPEAPCQQQPQHTAAAAAAAAGASAALNPLDLDRLFHEGDDRTWDADEWAWDPSELVAAPHGVPTVNACQVRALSPCERVWMFRRRCLVTSSAPNTPAPAVGLLLVSVP